jgi:hypothetical protein
VLWMGPTGQMLLHHEGSLGYAIAIGFLLYAIGQGLWLAGQAARTLHHLQTTTEIDLNGTPARLLPTHHPYSARIGFWQPQLVISQGLLQVLDADQLNAVLIHEQAHALYHDTFWFFWLGWLRRLTPWLPRTEALWQDLLLLRELRADCHAAQQVDPLLLAEALFLVVSAPLQELLGSQSPAQPDICAPFAWMQSEPIAGDRLTQRIDSLLSADTTVAQTSSSRYLWLIWACLPLLTIPLHG